MPVPSIWCHAKESTYIIGKSCESIVFGRGRSMARLQSIVTHQFDVFVISLCSNDIPCSNHFYLYAITSCCLHLQLILTMLALTIITMICTAIQPSLSLYEKYLIQNFMRIIVVASNSIQDYNTNYFTPPRKTQHGKHYS